MKERRVDYEVSEGAGSQSLVDRDKEFALCSQREAIVYFVWRRDMV